MKNEYVKPEMKIEEFFANQHVAACGDTEYGKYKFKCDANKGTLYYYPGYRASGTQPSSTVNHDKLGNFSPCSTTHEADTKGDFYWGFVDTNRNGKEDTGEAVIVYIEWGRSRGQTYVEDAHATKNLNQDSWEIVKS